MLPGVRISRRPCHSSHQRRTHLSGRNAREARARDFLARWFRPGRASGWGGAGARGALLPASKIAAQRRRPEGGGERGLFRRLVRNGFGGGTGPPARSLPADARRTEIRLRARLQLLGFYFEPLFWPRFPGRRRWRRVEGAQRAVPARAINRARSAALCYSRIPSAVRAQQGALIVVAAADPDAYRPAAGSPPLESRANAYCAREGKFVPAPRRPRPRCPPPGPTWLGPSALECEQPHYPEPHGGLGALEVSCTWRVRAALIAFSAWLGMVEWAVPLRSRPVKVAGSFTP